MTQANGPAEPPSGKGAAFFERGEEVAGTGNWDFAIEMYLEGIRREPENIERGHQPLREVALKRKAQGGKGPSLREQLKRRPSRDQVQSLVNAEFLLSKQPGSAGYMEQALKAAVALGSAAVVKWIGDLLLELQRQAKKPSKRVFLLLTRSYEGIEEYASAVQACEMARDLSPNDGQIQEQLMGLSARYTIQKGRYDEEGDFTRSVKDLEKQKEQIQRDMLVRDREHLDQSIEKARQEYLADPTVIGKVNGLVDALLEIEEEAFENEAIDVLTKAHRDTGAYRFKMRIGDIRIRQMTRRYRKLLADGDKEAAAQQARRQLEFELEEYTDRSSNYPTDLTIKFQLARRQFLAGQLDDAIASLQQAQRDPRRHLQAMTLLGQAFAKKQWHHEAAETFERALATDMPEERAIELRYNLGDVLERLGELERALEQFSQIAQIDYQYQDVRDRVEKLRKQIDPGAPGPDKKADD